MLETTKRLTPQDAGAARVSKRLPEVAKTAPSRSRLRAALVLVGLGLTLTLAPGQYVISVMAGYIHHAEGEVYLDDKPIAPAKTDLLHVQDGQRLRTGAGKAEIMLDPGSYLRLAPNSEMEMINAGLLSAELGFHGGSVMVDLPYLVEQDGIRMSAAGGEVLFRKEGLYRLDELDGSTTLRVLKGRATVDTEQGAFQVKSKQSLAFTSLAGPTKISKLDTLESDALGAWNKTRQEQLLAMAEKARREEDSDMLAVERALLEMILRRPSQMPRSDPRPPSSQPSGGGQGGQGRQR